MKICAYCKELKEFIEFSKESKGKDKCRSYCRKCVSIKRKIRLSDPIEKAKEDKRDRDRYRNKVGMSLDLPIGQVRKPRANTSHINGGGYRVITRSGHHLADKSGRLLEHLFVMYEHLGRKRIPGETVHHKNGIRTDNRIENLELWNNKHPSGQRVEDKIKFYIEFLEQYGYKVEKQ